MGASFFALVALAQFTLGLKRICWKQKAARAVEQEPVVRRCCSTVRLTPRYRSAGPDEARQRLGS